jgi:hypothetical protein
MNFTIKDYETIVRYQYIIMLLLEKGTLGKDVAILQRRRKIGPRVGDVDRRPPAGYCLPPLRFIYFTLQPWLNSRLRSGKSTTPNTPDAQQPLLRWREVTLGVKFHRMQLCPGLSG